MLLTSRLGTGHPLSGTGYELISISAVIIGGASLFGGVGRVMGVVAGLRLLALLLVVAVVGAVLSHDVLLGPETEREAPLTAVL